MWNNLVRKIIEEICSFRIRMILSVTRGKSLQHPYDFVKFSLCCGLCRICSTLFEVLRKRKKMRRTSRIIRRFSCSVLLYQFIVRLRHFFTYLQVMLTSSIISSVFLMAVYTFWSNYFWVSTFRKIMIL